MNALLYTVSLLCVVAQGAQVRPDFSGRWAILIASETGPAVVRELEVEYSAAKNTLVVSRRMSGPAYKDTYTLGSTSEKPVMGPRGPMTKGLRTMAWEGAVLVIADITSITRDQDSGREERWSLDARGQLQTVVTVWSPGGDDKTTTILYKRVSKNPVK